MKQQEQPITLEQGIDEYFGGLLTLAKSTLPWKCKCKAEAGECMSLSQIKDHIRHEHKERIIKVAYGE